MNRRDAYAQMMYELEDLQGRLRDEWLSDSLPLAWDGVWITEPTRKDAGDNPHRQGHAALVSQDGRGVRTASEPDIADLLAGPAGRRDQEVPE
ncbi:hypothetical protein OS190_02925 [Sulfitobacter sp. F26204]|nr:hypothetical protein [Sulfitobacter sp. F26204]MCX7558505.1 hypothetical protein [Sulfitobacter sp. F26204]